MTNCLFYSIFFVLFLSTSFGSLRYSQINRTFLSIYKGMLEACLITIDDNGEPLIPYYDENLVSSYVVNYLDKNIGKYSKNYTLVTVFMNENMTDFCNLECRTLKISLKAEINPLFIYEKDQFFAIKSKEQL